MTKGTRIDWKLDGFEQARNDPRVHAKLDKLGEAIVKDASENGRVKGYIWAPRDLQRNRAAGSVLIFGHAYNHNRKYNAVLKAMYRNKEA